MKTSGKVAAKIAEKKAKIAEKCGKKTAKVAGLLFALAVILTGCATSDPSSRSTTATYGDIVVKVGEGASNNTVKVTLGDGAIASADSAGSTETTTASPTNTTDVKPKTDVNTTGGRTAGVLESIVGSFGNWLTTPSEKTGNATVTPCTTGNCTTGDCSTGNCTDGSCSTCTDCSR